MQELRKKLADISSINKEYRNEVRWWLSEGLHTDQTLKNEVKMLDEAGFGAAEFLAMGDYGVDVARYGWGSEEFVHDTQLILEQTTAHGMGASMTSGTNWSNANLNNIVPDDMAAAKELAYVAEPLQAGTRYSKKIPHAPITRKNVSAQTLIAVVAMPHRGKAADGARDVLAREGIVLTDAVRDEFLNWKVPDDGDYILFTVWMQGTGQTASPSCSVNYTINYIDKYGTEALIDYWNQSVLSPKMRETILKNGRIQLYMDSLELTTYANGGQFWGYHFMDEFKARRGYDLAPHLPLIFKKSAMMMVATVPYRYVCEDEIFFAKLKNDLYQTMTDLYMENVLMPIQKWLHGVGMTLRAEISYGLPFEISQPGKYVDGIETESLEFASQIDSYRGMAGAAHIYNRLFSSETGATLANYRKNLDFYTQIIYTQFAAGVARTVLHGYASVCGSDAITQWPGHEGMLPIFSERFGSRQPAYRHYNAWNDMIARYQYILRQGKPRMDIGMLRLDYCYNNQLMAAGGEDMLYEQMFMRGNEGIYWKDTALQNAGYTYDYFAPQLLLDTDCDGTVAPGGPGYQAIIVYQDMLDVPSAAALLERARAGVRVLFVNGVTEMLAMGLDKTYEKAAAMTPFNDGKEAELADIVARIKALPVCAEVDGPENALPALKKLGVEPRIRFGAANRNVLPFMREDGAVRYAYLYNCMYTETEPVKFRAEILGEGVPYAIDCWTGEVSPVGKYEIRDGRTVVDVILNPGDACMYALNTAEKPAAHVTATDADLVRVCGGKVFLGAGKSGEYTAKTGCGCEKKVSISAPADISIPEWTLSVESWDAGKKVELTEDRGLGYVTKEIYFETDKTMLEAGQVAPAPWKDIPAIGPEVSGVGFYSAEFELPADWSNENAAIFAMDSVCGSTAAVYVNGAKAPAVNFDKPEVDITALVKPGKNSIKVEVASTLTNRLIARGYFKGIPQSMGTIMSDPTVFGESLGEAPEAPAPGEEGGLPDIMGMYFNVQPVASGMTGSAVIRTYAFKEI
jgi:hypothetical protein